MSNGERNTQFYIPAGTVIFPPDGIRRVSLMFPDEDSAILFYELLREFVIAAEIKK